MFLFLCLARSLQVERPELGEDVVKVLDDRTMRETIKKDRTAFVLFHADHQRLSDAAYLKYSAIARNHKSDSKFYVVPASAGQDVARTYNVVGYPFLMHFRYGTKTGTHLGMYSGNSIQRFVTNHSTLPALNIVSGSSQSDVVNQIANEFAEASAIVLVLSDSSSEFGKVSNNLVDELSHFIPFARITNESLAKELGFKFPSILMLRPDDSQTIYYDGSIDSDEMFMWVMHNSIPKFRPLNPEKLFSHDGVSLESVIGFYKGTGSDDLFISLGNISNQVQWMNVFYVDINEMPSLAKIFGVTDEKLVFVRANYSKIQYNVQSIQKTEAALDFRDGKLELTTIQTPPRLYGDVRKITEQEFERMQEQGTFVIMFGSAFCSKCRPLREAYFDAGHALGRQNSNITLAYWDVTEATPSFNKERDIGVPSIFVLPGGNMDKMVAYTGPTNLLSIVEWASGVAGNSEAADDMIRSELGAEFDEI